MYKFVLLLLSLAVSTQAQIPGFGRCPNVTVEQSFNPNFYLGKWYEQSKYPNSFEGNGKCVIASYNPGTNGVVNVVNTLIRPSDNKESSTNGTATVVSKTGEGKLEVSLAAAPFPAPYWILDTDYNSYSVVYSCVDLFLFHFKYVWVLTRARYPTNQTLNSAYAVLDANKLDRKNTTLVKVDQTSCPIYW